MHRSRQLGPALLPLVVGLLAIIGATGCATTREPARDDVSNLSVLTLNIWHNQQDWPARLELILDEIRALDPDIIALQEVLQNDSLPNQAYTLAEALDYDVHFTSVDPEGSVKRYGNAILSRHPVVERGRKLLEPLNDYRNVAHARINVGGTHIDVYNTHLHHTAEGGETRRTQIIDLLEFIEETRGSAPVLLLGDFNAETDWPEMQPILDRFEDALGLLEPEIADTVTTLNLAKGHTPRRIDHIFFRSGPEATLVPRDADVVFDRPTAGVWPSDHFGVIATFEVPEAIPFGAALRETEPHLRVEDMLRGRFPGVRVQGLPGGGFRVRVWGPGTFLGDTEPLYVVDGMPIQVDPNRGLYWLNPQDIADIEVLKDIAETAMYGARGGNGVVLITTRNGKDGREP